MSCNWITVAQVCAVNPTHSQINHSKISVELDSHVDTCVVGSNVLIIHDHECFVDIYGFGEEIWHLNACAMDAAIRFKDLMMQSTVIIIINHAIKIDSMSNILVCSMQCQVHGTIENEYPKFLSAQPAEDNHALLVHDPDGCSPPLALTIPLSQDGVTSYFKA